MARNYQLELEACLRELAGQRPRLLLHSCCAPCSSYVLEYLSTFFEITVDYYNPNLDSEKEYQLRCAEQARFLEQAPFCTGVRLEAVPYEPAAFYSAVKGLERIPEGGERCFACYRLRLEQAARRCLDGGFDFFTTTLSISPHKNAAKLNEIGEELAAQYGVRWLPCDFKKKNGFKRSTKLAAEYGLYRQDYCGCIYSKQEAEQRLLHHKEESNA